MRNQPCPFLHRPIQPPIVSARAQSDAVSRIASSIVYCTCSRIPPPLRGSGRRSGAAVGQRLTQQRNLFPSSSRAAPSHPVLSRPVPSCPVPSRSRLMDPVCCRPAPSLLPSGDVSIAGSSPPGIPNCQSAGHVPCPAAARPRPRPVLSAQRNKAHAKRHARKKKKKIKKQTETKEKKKKLKAVAMQSLFLETPPPPPRLLPPRPTQRGIKTKRGPQESGSPPNSHLPPLPCVTPPALPGRRRAAPAPCSQRRLGTLG